MLEPLVLLIAAGLAIVAIAVAVLLIMRFIATGIRILNADANLISCPDCGRRISPRASACPHCGRPRPPPRQTAQPPAGQLR